MRGHNLNFALHIRVLFLVGGQVELPHAQEQIVRLNTEMKERNGVNTDDSVNGKDALLLVDAVGGGDSPVFVEQSGATLVQESGSSPLTERNLTFKSRVLPNV